MMCGWSLHCTEEEPPQKIADALQLAYGTVCDVVKHYKFFKEIEYETRKEIE